jgi:hypothetical protein
MAPLAKPCRWGWGTLVLITTLGIAPAVSVSLAQDLLPELAAPAAKRTAASEALDKQKQDATDLAAKSYMSALDAVEKSATIAGQLDVVAAVVKERESVASGSLEPELHKALPKAKLQSLRKSLLASIERINADFARRKQQANADYLRFIATLQAKAVSNPELAKQLASEKAALLSSGNAATQNGATTLKASRGKNAVVNGDFEKIVDGKPEGWNNANCVTVETENKNTFVRFKQSLNNDGSAINSSIKQDLELPKGAKSATVSAKLKTTNCVIPPTKKQHIKPTISLCFKNKNEKSFFWIVRSWAGKNGSWKTIQAEGLVPKDAIKVGVAAESGECPGQIDFDDIEVTFK